MRRLPFLALIGFIRVASVAAAENPDDRLLTLSIGDAIRRAQETSESLELAENGTIRSAAEVLRARSEWLPQLSGSITYDRSILSEYDDLFSSGDTSGDSSSSSSSTSAFSSLPFGADNTYRLGLSLSQSIYSGGRILARNRLAFLNVSLSSTQVDTVKSELALSVAQAYFDAVLTEKLLEISEATLARAEEALTTTKVGLEVGTVAEFDLLRAQVNFDNQRPVVVQRRYERDLAWLRFRQFFDLPPDHPIQLSTPLESTEDASLIETVRSLAGVPDADGTRLNIRQAETTVAMREQSLKMTRSQYFPVIRLTSSFGKVAYPDDLFPVWDDFRTNWTAGIALQVPLFTGFRLRGDMLGARADVSDARVRLKQAQELSRVDSQNAQNQLEYATATWIASAGTVAQAERAYDIAALRFKEGVSNQLELTDARLSLQQAQINRARAARDLQVARIKVALLPHLPLNTGF